MVVVVILPKGVKEGHYLQEFPHKIDKSISSLNSIV